MGDRFANSRGEAGECHGDVVSTNHPFNWHINYSHVCVIHSPLSALEHTHTTHNIHVNFVSYTQVNFRHHIVEAGANRPIIKWKWIIFNCAINVSFNFTFIVSKLPGYARWWQSCFFGYTVGCRVPATWGTATFQIQGYEKVPVNPNVVHCDRYWLKLLAVLWQFEDQLLEKWFHSIAKLNETMLSTSSNQFVEFPLHWWISA